MDGLASLVSMDLVEQTDESGAQVSPGLPEGVKNYLIDIDGTVGHEEIMHDAGSTTRLDTPEGALIKLIKSSGSKPIRRNSTYDIYTEIELDDSGFTLPIISG